MEIVVLTTAYGLLFFYFFLITMAVADVVLTTVYGLSVSSSYVVDVATVATP